MLWLEVMLWTTWAMMLAWWPCCCGGSVPGYAACSYCTGTGDNSPEYMTLVISGVANNACSDCGEYNGTWVILWSSACIWQEVVEVGCGCETVLQVRARWVPGASPTEYRLSSGLWIMCTHGTNDGVCEAPPGPDKSYHAWTGYTDYGTTAVACLELVDESIGNLSNANASTSYTPYPCTSATCDFSSATMTVSSGDQS